MSGQIYWNTLSSKKICIEFESIRLHIEYQDTSDGEFFDAMDISPSEYVIGQDAEWDFNSLHEQIANIISQSSETDDDHEDCLGIDAIAFQIENFAAFVQIRFKLFYVLIRKTWSFEFHNLNLITNSRTLRKDFESANFFKSFDSSMDKKLSFESFRFFVINQPGNEILCQGLVELTGSVDINNRPNIYCTVENPVQIFISNPETLTSIQDILRSQYNLPKANFGSGSIKFNATLAKVVYKQTINGKAIEGTFFDLKIASDEKSTILYCSQVLFTDEIEARKHDMVNIENLKMVYFFNDHAVSSSVENVAFQISSCVHLLMAVKSKSSDHEFSSQKFSFDIHFDNVCLINCDGQLILKKISLTFDTKTKLDFKIEYLRFESDIYKEPVCEAMSIKSCIQRPIHAEILSDVDNCDFVKEGRFYPFSSVQHLIDDEVFIDAMDTNRATSMQQDLMNNLKNQSYVINMTASVILIHYSPKLNKIYHQMIFNFMSSESEGDAQSNERSIFLILNSEKGNNYYR